MIKVTERFINKIELTNKSRFNKMEIVHVSSRGQIVIPEGVRKKLGIKEKSKLLLVEKGDTILLRREEDVAKYFDDLERRESMGWLLLTEKSLKKLWDNPKDDEIWEKYL